MQQALNPATQAGSRQNVCQPLVFQMRNVRRTDWNLMKTEMISIVTRVVPRQGKGQDRIEIQQHGDLITVVLADGAGGLAGGAEAADYVVNTLSNQVFSLNSLSLFDAIYDADSELLASPNTGETTIVLLTLSGTEYSGVAVGDSEIFSIDNGKLLNLAEQKKTKPLVGSSGCVPMPFNGDVKNGRVLICSDGLWKYASSQTIENAMRYSNLDEAADILISSVKLPNGVFQDDVSLVMLEKASEV